MIIFQEFQTRANRVCAVFCYNKYILSKKKKKKGHLNDQKNKYKHTHAHTERERRFGSVEAN